MTIDKVAVTQPVMVRPDHCSGSRQGESREVEIKMGKFHSFIPINICSVSTMRQALKHGLGIREGPERGLG